MKSFITVLMLAIVTASGCKSKMHSTSSSVNNATVAAGTTRGKVSHQYRSTGCPTVIIVSEKDNIITLIPIPKDVLGADLDVDGLEISFNYHPLKMPQPKGCSKGIPAELTTIARVKK